MNFLLGHVAAQTKQMFPEAPVRIDEKNMPERQ
jgi:hypothetical protein